MSNTFAIASMSRILRAVKPLCIRSIFLLPEFSCFLLNALLARVFLFIPHSHNNHLRFSLNCWGPSSISSFIFFLHFESGTTCSFRSLPKVFALVPQVPVGRTEVLWGTDLTLGLVSPGLLNLALRLLLVLSLLSPVVLCCPHIHLL